MITVGINRNEEARRFRIYKTFEEAKEHCYPGATVVRAVNTYFQSERLGFIVMDVHEANFRMIGER